jgi:hypothetical protein
MDTVTYCSFLFQISTLPDRELRLMDLKPHDIVVIKCKCGRPVEYLYGYLQRHYRVPTPRT